MCGRYTITVSLEELMLFFSIDQPNVPFHIPRYNVAPMQMVPAILNDGERNRLGELRWGLVPVWAKDPKIGNLMINARSETITEKPAFRGLLTRKRCVIPADGFYEWKKEGSKKQPYRIVLRSRTLFGFAGLYDTWTGPNGEKISTCTVITTTPNKLMEDIHDRMPVILQPEDEEVWLDRKNQDKDFLQSILRPYDASDMYAYPVGSAVGNVRNNSPDLIEAIN
ncbi:SOS response-associated peptidase [Paenibacillus sp. GYB003]|uniref:SOS response-associated peptidase n=1 Tax=Paenibacillus sp. GYB003 TaxID=2994392 RepID=UPI002F96C1A2